jgi:formylglycine-generating enzyme required for sulfatase activity
VKGDLGGEIQRRLRKVFETPLRRGVENLPALIRRRAAAAEALARVESGIPGTQPAFWRLPHGEPVWIDIPAGGFWMGTREEEIPALVDRLGGQREWYEWEVPQHQVMMPVFKIARVPVTNAQYQLFVEATDHELPPHWEDGRPPKGLESHPVVRVTWHDAIAYCHWLSEVTGKPVTLPSEAEWEKAARGAKGRREYPWGDEWDETKCNTDELGLGGTTPVGIFPEGVSPYGCLDMAGNVWEWTRSLWGEDGSEPDFKYPYTPTDGRENLEAGNGVLRVLRGGSWDNYRRYARCAYRLRHLRLVDLGFRVVVSPASPASVL